MEKIRISPNTFIPMPVTLVGATVDGKPNFMAVGWVSRLNAAPPCIGISIGKPHYTPIGIEQSKSFSVNFPSAEMVVETDYCGIVSGRKTDKSALFDLFYGELQTAPMIRKCPLCLECRLVDIYDMKTNRLFVGEIVGAYTEDRFLTGEKPDYGKMNAMILTMPDNRYWTMGEPIAEAWSIGRSFNKT